MISKDKIRDLLGTGLNNEVVASAVGCAPAYISQLMADENFASEVVALRTNSLTENSERDSNINKIEDSLIIRLKDLLDTEQIYKPNDVLRAFAVCNAAKRRGVAASGNLPIQQKIVNLTIPVQVVTTFTTNTKGEVVDVEGQTLVTMPAHTLLKKLVEAKGGEHGAVYEKISRHLPATVEN